MPHWQESYTRLRQALPARPRLRPIKFDAINNRVIYSRQGLERVWSQSVTNLKQLKLWQIDPFRLMAAFVNDFFLTTSFAASYREGSKH
jgi:hypothetical protein